MCRLVRFVVTIAALTIALTSSALAQELTDPYEILNRYFNASGGLERMKAERTTYLEGSVSIGGMNGTIKSWTKVPGLSRTELALGPLNIVQGDNGQHAWVVDQNGKLQVITNPDQATANRRRVRKLMEEHAYADPESDIFTLRLVGIQPVNGSDCYVIEIANNINVDKYYYIINTVTFTRDKTSFEEDDESRDALYGEYREVDGLTVPFWTKETIYQTGQTQETKITNYESNPEIDPAVFEPPEEGAKDYRFTTGDRSENVPIKFAENHIYVRVTVQGKERWWILDTGAGMSVLNQAFADELGLSSEGEVKGQGAGGTVTISLAKMPPFSVKGIEFDGQTVAVIDMSALFGRLPLDVAGILGFDFLSRFVTKVDFANELVSFYDPETFAYGGDGHVVNMHLDNSLFTAQATLDGTHSGIWLFDLGAGTVHLDGRYARREGYADRKGVISMGHGAGNEYQLKSVRCDSIQFAGYTVYEPEISFAYGGTDTTFAADRIGTLGNSLFRNFVVYCDYAGERLIIEKGAKFNQAWPRDRSGLQLARDENCAIVVSYVSPETPAEKAGFAKGDLLRSVDGKSVDSFDGIMALRGLFKADPGTAYEIVVEREGSDKHLTMELAELF